MGTLTALQDYLAREDALTTLQRVQFTTSRYATFRDHLANVVAQVTGSGTTPIRRYPVPGDLLAATWLADPAHDGPRQTAQTAYAQNRSKLAAVVGRFDALYDETLAQPLTDPTAGNGEAALQAQRAAAEASWQDFETATTAGFDALITALGHPELASSQRCRLARHRAGAAYRSTAIARSAPC